MKKNSLKPLATQDLNRHHLPSILLKPIILIYKSLGMFKHTVLISVFGFSSHCKHQPTCSEYFYQQINNRGTIGELLSAFKRILTCF